MAKINIWDSWNGKFSNAIKEHWISLGHEVQFNPHYDTPADIGFFYTSDNATQVGVRECVAKKIYVQCVDIEVWGGQAAGVDWSKVTGAIFMVDHIRKMVDTKGVPTAIIQPGIDLTKFTLAPLDRFTDPIRRIAYVVGDNRIWDVKRFDIALQLLYDVRKLKPELIWQLCVRGTYSTHVQYNAYCKHLIKELKLEDFIVWSDRVDDMNKYLDDKHYFVLPSTKEVFSYATGEAMAKGIKPVIGNWQSARETWGQYVNNSYMEMLERLTEDKYEPETYRKFVEDNHNIKTYFEQLDEAVLGGEV
jgi:glycosyltransferase involved in cell wall biosynthesis